MKMIFVDELSKSKIGRDGHFLDISPVMNHDAGIAHPRVIINIDEAENVTDSDEKKKDCDKNFQT